eukprot:4996015-Heterocapsa_arctica.AAC.1
MDCLWWFKWPPGKPPYFVKPNGNIVPFYAHNYVPYLNVEHPPVTAAPADETDAEEGVVEVMEEPDEPVP